MDLKIKKLIKQIDALNEALHKEYARLAGKYGFSINKRRIIFIENFKKRNKTLRIPAWKYIIPRNFRHFLSMPFIYTMVFPAVLLDISITAYNWVALPLYHIPIVKRKDFFIYDRRFLDYLNIIQKANCLYCSYMNGLFAYCVEIGARTERYWCPVKAANKPKTNHSWYNDFADYGNPEEWNDKFNDPKVFKGICEK